MILKVALQKVCVCVWGGGLGIKGFSAKKCFEVLLRSRITASKKETTHVGSEMCLIDGWIHSQSNFIYRGPFVKENVISKCLGWVGVGIDGSVNAWTD